MSPWMKKAFPSLNYKRDIVGDLIGGIFGGSGADEQAQAANQAAQVQAQASAEGIAENRRQFDKVVELMSPYVTAGTGALATQQVMLGLQGPDKQKQLLDAIAASPQMQAYATQGEQAILQNASATGGLRGGNIQGALAQFRPQLLNQLIEQQYGKLGGMTQIGQAAAAGQAAQGMATGANISNLLAQQGAARAGGIIAAGNEQANSFGSAMKIGSTIAGFFL